MSEQDLMTPQELADYLKVKLGWVYWRTRQKGEDAIPMIRLGKYIRFRLPDVLAWIEKSQGRVADL